MKPNLNLSILLALLIIFLSFNIFDSMFITNINYIEFNKKNQTQIKQSGLWNLTGSLIYIDDSDPNYNWSKTAFENEWCLGSGNWTDPYIIENVTIDGQNLGNCIEIRNSDAYFIIQNCIFYNSGSNSNNAGINLDNVDNGKITICNFTNNLYGIYLNECNNNTISRNIVIGNSTYSMGIRLYYSYNNNILENIVLSHYESGIFMSHSNNNTVSKNLLTYSYGIGIEISYCENNKISDNIANFNLVGIMISNSRYWNNITGNFANNNSLFGIYLYQCSDNLILGNNLCDNGFFGINLLHSRHIEVLGNIANNNNHSGIRLLSSSNNICEENTANYNPYGFSLEESNYNIISGNDLKGNDECIEEDDCIGNEFKNNKYCNYAESKEFPLLLVASISVVSAGIISGAVGIYFLKRKSRKTA